jgi:DUF1680 family protein
MMMSLGHSIVLVGGLFFLSVSEETRGQEVPVVPARTDFLEPGEIKVNGILGDAITAGRRGRLTQLPAWHDGELITMFGKEVKANHNKMDWYGEHAGKWMYTAAKAVKNSGDKNLEALLIKTADYFVRQQDADGYLGSYGPEIRITSTTVSHKRSWDAWNLSCMTLGLLEVNRYFPHPEYLNAAKGIGELFLKMFGEGKNDITEYGTRHGVSATIILDPVVELYKVTRDKRYLDLAEVIIKRMEANEGVKLVTVGMNGGDMENVGDGKAYQLLWNLTALAKLYEVTENPDYLKAVRNAWQNVADYHLTIAGGPWGGIGKHLECFNNKNFWSPYGFVETCSTMSWIQLNKQMLRLTGEAKYAQEIEKSTYNALLGARYTNGVDWCYHSFSNGSWHEAHFNDCCPSSGVMALEELPTIIYSRKEKGIACNLFVASEATLSLSKSNTVRIIQKTQYPIDGKIELTLLSSKSEAFPLFIRIPEWAATAVIKVNGKPVDPPELKKGEYAKLDRTWSKKDIVEIEFPFELIFHQKTEQAGAPQGGTAIYQVDWIALTRGPLVFAANGLIDGTDRERTLHVDATKPQQLFSPATNPVGAGPAFELKTTGHEPLLFLPYYEAGGSKTGAWRLTWLQNTIE